MADESGDEARGDARASEPGERGPAPPPPAPGWTAIPDQGMHGSPPPAPPGPGWNAIPNHGGATPPQPPPAPYGYGPQGPYPGYQWGSPPIAKPDSNLVGAILVTLFCCLPFGVVSIVYAAQVDSKWNAGDWNGARRAAQLAKSWGLAALITGVVVGLLWGLAAVSSSSSSGRY